MCEVARKHVDTPVRGVQLLGRYLDQHTGDLLGEWGDTIAAIERIPDDLAVENDPAAKAMVERFAERLQRTLEIIGSGSPLRALPGALDRAIDKV